MVAFRALHRITVRIQFEYLGAFKANMVSGVSRPSRQYFVSGLLGVDRTEELYYDLLHLCLKTGMVTVNTLTLGIHYIRIALVPAFHAEATLFAGKY
jgi:hypothetical protein